MDRTAVIDLGELGAAPVDPAVAPPTLHRRGTVAVVAAVLLAVLGGAAPVLPPPPPPLTIPALAGDAVFGEGDLLHVISPGYAAPEGVDQPHELRVYRLSAGELLHRVPLQVSGPVRFARRVGDVLYVGVEDGRPALAALDARTGRLRWSRPGFEFGFPLTGRTVLVLEPTDTHDGELVGVDPLTGAVRWRLPDVAQLVGFPDTLRVLTGGPGGRVELRDPDTAAVVVSAELPATAGRSGGPEPNLWSVGDLLLVAGDAEVTAYGLDRLDRRWTWRSASERAAYPWWSCAAVEVCLTDDTNEMYVIDPATGRLRWRSGPWTVAGWVAGHFLVHPDDPPTESAPLLMLDPVTGRPDADLGRWRPAGEPGPDGRLVMVQHDPSAGTLWYGTLDPATRAVRLLGKGSDVTGDCWTWSGVLTCRLPDASVGVWRLP